MRQRVVKGLFGIMLVLAMFACTPMDSGPSADEIIADDLVKAYLEDFEKGDIDKLMTYYSDEFTRMIPDEEWRKHLQHIFDNYGKATSYALAGKQVDTRFSGKFYIYRYNTRHNNNKRIKHIFTFRRPVEAQTKLLLVGHKITE